MRKGFFDVR